MKNRIQNLIFLISLFITSFLSYYISLYFLAFIIYLVSGIRLIYQYEKGVLFTLGKYSGLLDPGLVWYAPIIQTFKKVDTRIRTIDLPKQEVITKDNVPIKINATLFFKVEFVEKAILNVQDFTYATLHYAQTVIRDIIGGIDLDDVLQKRKEIADKVKNIVDEITDKWGIDVYAVRLQDIELPEEMRRAIARQAEAERERRSVIIKSQGEVKAAENLAKAGKILNKVPTAIHLRTLHTLADISTDPNQKVVILLPFENIKDIFKKK